MQVSGPVARPVSVAAYSARQQPAFFGGLHTAPVYSCPPVYAAPRYYRPYHCAPVYWSSWRDPWWYRPVWCEPWYRSWCWSPAYSWCGATSGLGFSYSSWGGSSAFSIGFSFFNYCPPVYRNPCPELWVDYWNAWPTTTVVVAPAPVERIVYTPSAPRVVDVVVPQYQPTIYRADVLSGVLSFADTPGSIATSLQDSPIEARAERAAQYLGRVPAGAWDVTFVAQRIVGDNREMIFRAMDPNARGVLAQVVVRPGPDPIPELRPGQKAQITGRLAEITVDDPIEPGGRFVLEDGAIRR